jgi:hypothetical protein
MKILIALAIASVATLTHAETPEDRCENLAVFAQGVAEVRDSGTRLSEVLEIVKERAGNGMVDAYTIAAKMAYRFGHLSPIEVREGLLAGCLETVRAERIKRGSSLKTAF